MCDGNQSSSLDDYVINVGAAGSLTFLSGQDFPSAAFRYRPPSKTSRKLSVYGSSQWLDFSCPHRLEKSFRFTHTHSLNTSRLIGAIYNSIWNAQTSVMVSSHDHLMMIYSVSESWMQMFHLISPTRPENESNERLFRINLPSVSVCLICHQRDRKQLNNHSIIFSPSKV